MPYNFVITKEWIFMVLRRQPEYKGLSCNSLGYIGLLFAKSEEQKQMIMETTPIEILQSLAAPMYGKTYNQY